MKPFPATYGVLFDMLTIFIYFFHKLKILRIFSLKSKSYNCGDVANIESIRAQDQKYMTSLCYNGGGMKR